MIRALRTLYFQTYVQRSFIFEDRQHRLYMLRRSQLVLSNFVGLSLATKPSASASVVVLHIRIVVYSSMRAV